MEGEEVVYDFPAVSDGSTRPPSDLVGAAPGTLTVSDETVYQASDDRFGKGPKIGTVTIEHVKSSTGERVVFRADFEFDDGDTVTLGGAVPGNGNWQGRGRAGYAGGTGKFADRRGQLPVDSENPKRWG